eukprot:scaffold194192_cov28-Tisochrysis_lutea.AAC.1
MGMACGAVALDESNRASCCLALKSSQKSRGSSSPLSWSRDSSSSPPSSEGSADDAGPPSPRSLSSSLIPLVSSL